MEEIIFEDAIAELEKIVKKLEEGKMPLDDAIKSFERGMYLKKLCEEKLKNAKLKIESIKLTAEQDEQE